MTEQYKWLNARYLIDAKKEVDSLWFISNNKDKINDDLKRLIELHRNSFYINATTVVDKYISDKMGHVFSKEKDEKKRLCNQYCKVNELYMYRDKHAAHKDNDFKDKDFGTLMDIVNDCANMLCTVREICADSLPNVITLDFVCYDGGLFRGINGITKELENKILQSEHSISDVNNTSNKKEKNIVLKVFNDTEDLSKVNNKTDYCVVLERGLTLGESLQKRQDACIKINVLHGTQIWAHLTCQQLNCSNDN